ncbi:MAG: ABC transporter permease [Flavobacteriales bacterium]|nr:ABC transporter permease [Flavobacteriales bacterium]
MNKIGLITWREYSTRVKKKSFIVMTLLGPVLIAAFYGILIYLVVNEDIASEEKQILVVDESGIFEDRLSSGELLKLDYRRSRDKALTDSALLATYDGWLSIPSGFKVSDPSGIVYRSRKNISIQLKEDLSNRMEKVLSDYKMEQYGVSRELIDSVKSSVSIRAVTVDKSGKEKNTSTELYAAIGMVLAIAIYFFVFLYGVQVMRGVIEEKTNRIVEIIVSSVRPFQLMMGKVFGLAMVGFTQILIWVVLSGLLITGISLFMGGDMESIQDISKQAQEMQSMQQLPEGTDLTAFEEIKLALSELNIPFILATFIFYFLGGYLMYSSLFAAVGAAVDAETDTQQFMLPITLPLVFAFVLSTSVVLRDPNGTLSFWMSIFPLTSPVVMMVRLPFLTLSEQWWELLLSMAALVLTFCFTIWLAGKIYRVGILMYGKKVSYKELYKWLRHGN